MKTKKEEKEKKKKFKFKTKPRGAAVPKRISYLADMMQEKARPKLIGAEPMGTTVPMFSGYSNPGVYTHSNPGVPAAPNNYTHPDTARETGARLTTNDLTKIKEAERRAKGLL